ncbi:hypothetical protein JHN52_03135 [Streptomyces sp. MBT97]|uniref:hypothetical protein n=1 Tax=Streptomyces sp. MBT97 TaxID=2800411 RepID=UPI00190D651B|nr:hypothetical protein [Streptomyces sp. MBT97]MBK3631964.1 hypothetical protein [Streptomyces sp. MBT97]
MVGEPRLALASAAVQQPDADAAAAAPPQEVGLLLLTPVEVDDAVIGPEQQAGLGTCVVPGERFAGRGPGDEAVGPSPAEPDVAPRDQDDAAPARPDVVPVSGAAGLAQSRVFQ